MKTAELSYFTAYVNLYEYFGMKLSRICSV